MQNHAILNSNINILSRELQMEQKKLVDENQKKHDELSVSSLFGFYFSPSFYKLFYIQNFLKNRHWFRI
jgi:hypothetical protein